VRVHLVVLAAAIAMVPSLAAADQIHVPSWVKNNAKWWSEGFVGDDDFIKGIQYLVDRGLMVIPGGVNATASPSQIPSWVKTDAGWWADGKVSDRDFVRGMEYLVGSGIIRMGSSGPFVISSPAFEDNGTIPMRYTCDGGSTPPPIDVSGIPHNARTLAITVVDIDAPAGPFTHWVAWNIPPNSTSLDTGNANAFSEGMTSAGTVGYRGPCPPSGTHRYYFTVYALDTALDLAQGASRTDLENAMAGHVVGKAVLLGTYSKN